MSLDLLVPHMFQVLQGSCLCHRWFCQVSSPTAPWVFPLPHLSEYERYVCLIISLLFVLILGGKNHEGKKVRLCSSLSPSTLPSASMEELLLLEWTNKSYSMKIRFAFIYSIYKHSLNAYLIWDTAARVSWGRVQDEAKDACGKIFKSLSGYSTVFVFNSKWDRSLGWGA